MGILSRFNIGLRAIDRDFGVVHKGWIVSIDATRDGKYLFTSDTEGVIKLWNPAGKEFICELNGAIHSADGKKPDTSIIGPDSDDPSIASALPKGVNAHPASIRAVRCTPDSKYLFSADLLGNVRQWDIESRLVIKQYKGSHCNLQLINSMQVTEDSQTLLIANDYGYLKIFHITPPCEEFVALGFVDQIVIAKDMGRISDGNISTMCVSHNMQYFFLATGYGNLIQYNFEHYEVEHHYGNVHNTDINCVVCTRSSLYLFTGDVKGVVKQFYILEKALIKDFGKIVDGSIWSITTSPDSNYLFVSDSKGALKMFDVGEESNKKSHGEIHDVEIKAICTSPDSQYLYTSDLNGNLKQWWIGTHKILRNYGVVMEGGITCIQCTPDSKH